MISDNSWAFMHEIFIENLVHEEKKQMPVEWSSTYA